MTTIAISAHPPSSPAKRYREAVRLDLLPNVAAVSDIWHWLILGAATVAAAAMRLGRHALAGIGTCAITLVVYPSFNGTGHQLRLSGAEDRAVKEGDVYKGALFLQRFIGLHVPPQVPLGFWYSSTPTRGARPIAVCRTSTEA